MLPIKCTYGLLRSAAGGRGVGQAGLAQRVGQSRPPRGGGGGAAAGRSAAATAGRQAAGRGGGGGGQGQAAGAQRSKALVDEGIRERGARVRARRANAAARAQGDGRRGHRTRRACGRLGSQGTLWVGQCTLNARKRTPSVCFPWEVHAGGAGGPLRDASPDGTWQTHSEEQGLPLEQHGIIALREFPEACGGGVCRGHSPREPNQARVKDQGIGRNRTVRW